MTDLECYINTAGFLDFVASQGVATGTTILVAGDLRDSTPRITNAVIQAIRDKGFAVEYHGLIPTPAIANHALRRGLPCIMVTGSHIPADRNGIKFYKADGEVMKADEAGIKAAVATVRQAVYAEEASVSQFAATGILKQPTALPGALPGAGDAYRKRYRAVFAGDCLAGKKIVFYQHSAVGRDMLVELLQGFGADVVPVGRADHFIPIDSENVTPDDQAYFRQLAAEHPDAFAIVSTDGDSDRPFMVDETGQFHRGDVLGAIVAEWLQATFAAYPISSSDALDTYLAGLALPYEHTKIGSPYVIEAMQKAEAAGQQRVVGWEVNGGFLLGTAIQVTGMELPALPTRDAFLPLMACLLAASQAGRKISELFATLPQRYTDAGLLDDFPVEVSQTIIAKFAQDTPEVRTALAGYFTAELGFGAITSINTLDGIRIYFDTGDIAHIRPSGNAPQLRIYSVANTPERAAQIVEQALAEPGGIFRRMQQALSVQ
jgi:phosphomannomutase